MYSTSRDDAEKQDVDNYEIDYKCLDFLGVLGEGAFGKVVKAEYYKNDVDREQGNGQVVAVKMMKGIVACRVHLLVINILYCVYPKYSQLSLYRLGTKKKNGMKPSLKR